MLSRRTLLAGAVAWAGCRRRRTHGFPGYAFVANEGGHAIAAVDLTAFAAARHIPLDAAPTVVVAPRSTASVLALTPATGGIHEIDASSLSLKRSVRVAAGGFQMRLSPGEDRLWVLCRHPSRLLEIDPASLGAASEVRLPEEPSSFDLSRDGSIAVIGFGSPGRIALADLQERRLVRTIHASASLGAVCFRSDDRCILAPELDRRMLSIYDTASGGVVTRLPLAVRPEHYCFRSDGGQMFISGEGMDAVVVVYPHKTPMVAETVLAGREPRAMGVSSGTPDLLFVTNPPTGNVTILDIVTRRVIGIVPVGAEPSFVTATPDSQYALVLNRASGDMAVIRVAGFTAKRGRLAPLFTMIPVGSRPVAAAVKAI